MSYFSEIDVILFAFDCDKSHASDKAIVPNLAVESNHNITEWNELTHPFGVIDGSYAAFCLTAEVNVVDELIVLTVDLDSMIWLLIPVVWGEDFQTDSTDYDVCHIKLFSLTNRQILVVTELLGLEATLVA